MTDRPILIVAHRTAASPKHLAAVAERAARGRAGSRSWSLGRIGTRDTEEAAMAARLMSVFQDGLLTLERLRTGGNQTVTVQHVNVQPGAQAVTGSVGKSRGERWEIAVMPCNGRPAAALTHERPATRAVRPL